MTTVDLNDVKRLADMLDAVELADEDRTTMRAIFALAGQAAGEKDDVGGLTIVYQQPSDPVQDGASIPGGSFESFQWGVRKGEASGAPIIDI